MGDNLLDDSGSSLSVEERSTAVAKASDNVSSIGVGRRCDISTKHLEGACSRWILGHTR